MKKSVFLMVLMIISSVLCFVPPAPAATNHVNNGDSIVLTWSTESPSSGDPIVKSNASSTGGIVGVALNGDGTESEDVTVSTKGVYKLPVRAISSAITVGEIIYTSVTGLQYGVASLTNVATGLKFGKALEALIVASNTQTIKVLIQP